MSISTCSTKSNPNISSGSEVSNLKKSMNNKLSNSIDLPKSNPNVLLCRKVKCA